MLKKYLCALLLICGQITSHAQISANQIAGQNMGTGYQFWVKAGVTYARNNATGNIEYQGTDSAKVIQSVVTALVGTGGKLHFAKGVYSFKSCQMETIAPYTNYCFAVGIPSPGISSYPEFEFEGESAGIGSQVHPAAQGVVFNVTATAEAIAGSANTVVGFWMRPNTTQDNQYPAGAGLYWNDHILFKSLALNFPNNQRGNEHAFNMLEASYARFDNVQAGFNAISTALGTANLKAFVSPGTPSDGVHLEDTQVDPGFDLAYSINTEHSVLINTETYEDTHCYVLGDMIASHGTALYHSNQWIHPEVYDCKYGVQVGQYINANVQLDLLGFDYEYTTSGPWAAQYAIDTKSSSGNEISGMLLWNDVQTNVGASYLATPFNTADGSGSLYTVSRRGVLDTYLFRPHQWIQVSNQGDYGIGADTVGNNPWAAYVYDAGRWLSDSQVGDTLGQTDRRMVWGNTVTALGIWGDAVHFPTVAYFGSKSATPTEIDQMGRIAVYDTANGHQYFLTVQNGVVTPVLKQ